MKRWHIILAAFAIGAMWEAVAFLIKQPILPSPSNVFIVFIQELSGDLSHHFLASLWRVIASILLSIIIAAPLGLILGQSKRLDQFISPFIYILYPIPKVVFVPLVLLFLGVGDFSKIAIITFE